MTEEKKRKNSQARIDGNHRWDAANYDRFSIRLPKGTRERIEATGMSFNGFCRQAIMEKLDN